MAIHKKHILLLVMVALCLSSCEILRAPFKIIGGILEAIPKLLMLSENTGTPAPQGIPAQALARLHERIKQKVRAGNLPEGSKVLRRYLKQHKTPPRIAIIDLRRRDAIREIHNMYLELSKQGKVTCVVVNGAQLSAAMLQSIARQVGDRGGSIDTSAADNTYCINEN